MLLLTLSSQKYFSSTDGNIKWFAGDKCQMAYQCVMDDLSNQYSIKNDLWNILNILCECKKLKYKKKY